MNQDLIFQKFGGYYSANEDTYHMGIHHILGDKIAQRFFGHKVCLDACLGAGFMTLSLAKYVDKIIGVETNLFHLEQAKNNANLASVGNKVKFISGDILKVVRKIKKIDSAFIDPDWAKTGDNKENHVSDLSEMVPPVDKLLEEIFIKTKNICLRLPKTFDLEKLDVLPEHEIESVYLDNKLRFHCVYFGDLIRNKGRSSLKI